MLVKTQCHSQREYYIADINRTITINVTKEATTAARSDDRIVYCRVAPVCYEEVLTGGIIGYLRIFLVIRSAGDREIASVRSAVCIY